MTRPTYETASNLAAEMAVLRRLEHQWKCVGQKLPIAYQLDYALTVEDKIVAWAEIKCRTTKYSDMYLSLHKWMAGKNLYRDTGLPFILVYSFKHEIYWKPVHNDNPELEIGGRWDRGDWQDTEPMAVFKLDTFKVLRET